MFQGKVILVVDDEADLREILRNELDFEGATVIEASNGKEAFEKFSRSNVQAVLSDIRMPGGDGATLARQIRNTHPFEPVLILMTGFADLHSEEAYALGADGYVMKPYRLEDLKLTLHRLLSPPQQRWNQNPAKIPQNLLLKQNLTDCIEKGFLVLGRGGFFLKWDPDQIRAGDFIQVRFLDTAPIQVQVRWIRSEVEDQKPIGMGMEFIQIPSDVLSALDRVRPQWKSEKSFIPRN